MTEERYTRIIGTECFNTSYRDLIEKLHECVADGDGEVISVDFTNVHIVTMRRCDSRFASITGGVDYFVPDSQVLYAAVRLLGGEMTDRVYGPAFMKKCVTQSPAPFSHYFLGGSQACLDNLVASFQRQQPNLNLVGCCNGYFDLEKEDEIIDEINRLKPNFLWVGLGTPKQQEWIARNRPKLKQGIILAVGFAFDVNAGTKSDAPEWMQRSGLTWLYRLGAEPRRLFWRYLKYNSLFAWYFFVDHLLKMETAKASQTTTPTYRNNSR